MAPKITFHQALFGYDSGHHLLASSLSLSADVKHLLAVATDLSGSSPSSGFEFSYTGIPLAGSKYFALFCTWQAHEMPRPGSVWSQVLFIELGDLAQLEDLGVLRTLFRRPVDQNFELYRHPITFSSHIRSERKLFGNGLIAAPRVLDALYKTPHRSVVILDTEETSAEELIFTLWSQQWPKLRRNFRFSTGSFADRGAPKSAFDLQVAPIMSRRLWQREDQHLVLDLSDKSDQHSDPSSTGGWIQLALQDLVSPGRTGLRDFLIVFGSDIEQPRAAFAKLASIYDSLRTGSNTSWRRSLELIAELFPNATEAIRLKESACEISLEDESELSINHALSTVLFLVTSPEAGPFSNVTVNLEHLVEFLWSHRRQDVLTLLSESMRRPETALAASFAESVARVVHSSDLALIGDRQPELLNLMLRLNPQLAFDEQLWSSSPEVQWRAFEVLDAIRMRPEEWARLIGTMRPGFTAIPARTLVQRANSFALQGIFEWLSKPDNGEWLPTEQWRDALSEAAADQLQTTEFLSPLRLAFCAWLAPPDIARALLRSSRPDIQLLAKQALEELPTWLRSHTAFLLVTLGLTSTEESGVECIVRSFFDVHEQLARGQYSGESWRLLAPCLPDLGFWKEWDRCKKLRKAVRELPDGYRQLVANALLESSQSPEQEKLAIRISKRHLKK
ncbi:GAP1-N1 domain-containing protein [Terriglobus albidus]|uniref:GAP1-N1 domain-containing protein n=1 Tax=Terriglobus albidus TaxID=1592106 RepID=UPI0021DF535C|nr:hypothetical protein [Terriglobus albidus]